MKLTKRITALCLSVLLLLPLAVGVMAETAYTLSDVTNLLKYVAGWGDEYRKDGYDYNSDGNVNLYDATCILKAIAGWDENNICLKKTSDEYIRQIEEEIEAYHAEYDGHLVGIDYTVKIRKYYGTYNGAVAVVYTGGGLQSIGPSEIRHIIADSEFYYPHGGTIKVWKEGNHYTMEQAYEEGILTKEQVKRIADLHNHGGYISYK